MNFILVQHSSIHSVGPTQIWSKGEEKKSYRVFIIKCMLNKHSDYMFIYWLISVQLQTTTNYRQGVV